MPFNVHSSRLFSFILPMPTPFPLKDAPPVHNGFSAVWSARREREPGLTYDYLMGMTGGAWLTCHGEEAGRPLWLWEALRYLPLGLRRLGYTAEPLNQTEFNEGARRARKGVTAVRLNPTHAERLGDPVTNDRIWIPVTSANSSLRGRGKREDWTYILLRPDNHSKGLRSHRQWSALADGVATLFRPAFLTNSRDAQPTEAAVGLAVYGLWCDTLQDQSVRHSTLRAQAEVWLEAHRTGAAFLFDLAGSQRTAYANRLRRAAELFKQEVSDCLTPLSNLPTRSVINQAPNLLEQAHHFAGEGALLMAEAAFIALQLPTVATHALLEPPNLPLDGMPLQEVLYLARAGTPPLRLLAARRLAGSDRPQVVSTLTQLLYDADYRVRQTAVWSLEEIGPPGLVRILGSALRSDVPETVELARRHLVAMLTPEAETVLGEWRASLTAGSE